MLRFALIEEMNQVEYPTKETANDDFERAFSYFVMDMDYQAIRVFTRLINSNNDEATSLALKFAALYNN